MSEESNIRKHTLQQGSCEAFGEIQPWHIELLDRRQALIDEGKAKFIDWETVKRQIREAIQA